MKVKVHKFEVYVVDFDDMGVDDIEIALDQDSGLNATTVHEATKEVDWHDDIDLNQSGTSVRAYRKLFS